MAFFKNTKKMLENANSMMESAQQILSQHSAALQSATQPDPDDPAFAPIEGVTLEQYATITGGLIKNGIGGAEQVRAFAESNGVRPGTWDAVSSGWTDRMRTSEAVRIRYGALYRQATG